MKKRFCTKVICVTLASVLVLLAVMPMFAPWGITLSASPTGLGGAVTLEEAQARPGLYIKSGDRFIYVTSQAPDVLIGTSTNFRAALITPLDFQIPRIPNNSQLVVIGRQDIGIYPISRTGYTIPHIVTLGRSTGFMGAVSGGERIGLGGNSYETLNGGAPLDYAYRMIYGWAAGGHQGIFTASRGEQFTLGRFQGTNWVERTITANQRFFIIPNRPSRGTGRADYEIERTMNGYFEVNFATPPVGYFRMGDISNAGGGFGPPPSASNVRLFEFYDATSTPTIATPSTAQNAFVPPVTEVSAEVQEAIENFLMQFPTIFTNNSIHYRGRVVEGEQRFFGIPRQYGFELDDGRFNLGWDSATQQEIITDVRRFHIGYEFGERITHTWEGYTWESGSSYPILTYDMPDIFFRQFEDWERTGFYDRYDNRIYNADWMLWNSLYATGFSLWDFDRNGIPVIFVYYWGHYEGSGDGGTPTSMFRFIDGEYRRVAITNEQWGGPYSWRAAFTPQYYFDVNGNLILKNSGTDAFWYNQFTFDNQNITVTTTTLVTASMAWNERDNSVEWVWNNSITGETNIPVVGSAQDAINNTSQYIPGTNIALTRIYPLTELHEEITTSIIQQLEDK